MIMHFEILIQRFTLIQEGERGEKEEKSGLSKQTWLRTTLKEGVLMKLYGKE